MNKFILVILFVISGFSCLCQDFNARAIEITNEESGEYTTIETTKLKIRLPNNFTRKNATTYEHLLAESYISVQELDGDVNRNFYTFDKKSMFMAGIVVQKETFFKINGFDAMMIDGTHYLNEKEYAVSILIIGNCSQTYMIMGSALKPVKNNMNVQITAALLSVIFDPNMEASSIQDSFSYTIDVSGSGLIECRPIGETRTFSDDGNTPSKTDEMTSLTIHETKTNVQLTDIQKKEICSHLIKLYPLEWNEGSSLEPKRYSTGKLSGYEIYASGVNKFMMTEFIYQLVLFASDRYFVITGISYGDEDKCLKLFRSVSNTIDY